MNTKETNNIGVLLGRFAPIHLGHEHLIKLIIDKHGIEQTLILIGSANVKPNERTPFTYEQRKTMIKSIFPQINVLPLPDTNPEQIFHPKDTISINKWLNLIEEIQDKLQKNLIFYGGSQKDLQYLALRFTTKVLLDRENNQISATKVRELWQNKKMTELATIISPNVLSLLT